MLVRRTALWLAAISFLAAEISAAQNAIVVRLVDARSAAPLTHQQVWVQFYPRGSKRTQSIAKTSGSDGTARFPLPETLPETLYISIGRSEDSEPFSCGPGTEFVPQEVLATGILDKGSCQLSASASRLRTKPGELILFAHRHSLWFRMWYHVVAPLERE
jgi:hypothetical protein